MLLRFCIYFVLVLLYAFSLLILFLLLHNLFCIIVLLVKRVNHFDRKKNALYKMFDRFLNTPMNLPVAMLSKPHLFAAHSLRNDEEVCQNP